MAIEHAKKRRIGRELVDWIYLGVRTGARRSVEEYRAQMEAGNTERALAALKRGVDLPHRARRRIEALIERKSQQFLAECLSLFGSVTLADINAELTTLESYAAGLVAQSPSPYGDGTLTWDEIAADIEGRVEKESQEWVFPMPSGYRDVWGE